MSSSVSSTSTSTSSSHSSSSKTSQEENAAISLCHGRAAPGDIPQPLDIICGRGSRVSCHPGNQRFRNLIVSRKWDYQRAKRREEKTRITLEVIESLTTGPHPARFMLKDPDTAIWREVGMEYKKEKVSHALRSRSATEGGRQRRKDLRPKQEQQEHKKSRDTKKRNKPPLRRHRQQSLGHSKTSTLSPQMEALVGRMIEDQQALLASLIQENHVFSIDNTDLMASESTDPSSPSMVTIGEGDDTSKLSLASLNKHPG